MTYRFLGVVGVISIAAIALLLSAQEPDRRGNNPPEGAPRFGFGPPGFGQPGFGQPGDLFLGLPGIHGSVMDLMEIKEVQREIHVTEKQAQRLEPWARGAMDNLMQAMDPWSVFNGPEAERGKAIAEIARKRDGALAMAQTQLEQILDDQQMKRLHELQLQRQSVRGLLRPDVVSDLKLSEEQKVALEKLLPDTVIPPMPAFGGGPRGEFRRPDGNGGPARNGRPSNAIDDETRQAALAILDDVQRQKWATIQG
ncbi:MAG: hypothetical protein ABL921_17475, partial [Pirellula sp.]